MSEEWRMVSSRKPVEEMYDLDISIVSKVNRVAETRLQKYLSSLQEKYDVILYKLQKQIIETRRQVELMQTEKDKIAMKMLKKYTSKNTFENENGTQANRIHKTLASSTSTLASQPTATASESLPFSNVTTSNFESTLEPVFENAPYGKTVRPHTLGNPFKLSMRTEQKTDRRRKKGRRKFSSAQHLMELNERNLSRMDRNLGTSHGSDRKHFMNEDGSTTDLTFVTKIWEKNRCLTRGHLSSGDLSLESVYKLGEMSLGSQPKPRRSPGYEILTTSRPVRLEPLSGSHGLKSGSHLSVMTVI